MPLTYEIVTPERLVRQGEAYMVTVPGIEGDFGVLEHHAPFMTVLRDGPLKIYASADASPSEVQVQGGFAEVSARGLTILAEGAAAAA